MKEPIPPAKPPNMQAELAKERNRAAAERTIMAWIRTSLSLIGFGFGIDSVVSAIGSLQIAQNIDRVRLSHFLGLAFIGLGVYSLVVAAIEHNQQLKQIQQNENYFYTPRRSLGLTVATGLISVGAIAFLGVLWKAMI